MASYSKRKGDCKKPHKISYFKYDASGNKKYTSKSFKTYKEAMKFQTIVLQKEEAGPVGFNKDNITFQQLVDQFLEVHAPTEWKSTGTGVKNTGRLNNYILPVLGEKKLKDININCIERFYLDLQHKKSVKTNEYLSASLIDGIHSLLTTIFNYAIKNDYIVKNPCYKAIRPVYEPEERETWEEDYLKEALAKIMENEDRQTILLINIAFAGSLRASELAGIKMSDISINDIDKHARINLETGFQRVQKEAYEKMSPATRKKKYKRIYSSDKDSKTFMADTALKNKSSKRHFWLPKKLTKLLIEEMEYSKYINDQYDTVFKDGDFLFLNYKTGRPFDKDGIRSVFKRIIKKYNLSEITFHSVRHMSVQEKLKLANGDVKSVQGDSGHSKAEMVLEQYSHFQDNDRYSLAKIFEDEFYKDEFDESDEQASIVDHIRASFDVCKKVVQIIQGYPEVYEKVVGFIQSQSQIRC